MLEVYGRFLTNSKVASFCLVIRKRRSTRIANGKGRHHWAPFASDRPLGTAGPLLGQPVKAWLSIVSAVISIQIEFADTSDRCHGISLLRLENRHALRRPAHTAIQGPAASVCGTKLLDDPGP